MVCFVFKLILKAHAVYQNATICKDTKYNIIAHVSVQLPAILEFSSGHTTSRHGSIVCTTSYKMQQNNVKILNIQHRTLSSCSWRKIEKNWAWPKDDSFP